MFNNSKVTVTVSLRCDGDEKGQIGISWLLRLSPCALEYEEINSKTDKTILESYMKYPMPLYNPSVPMPYHTIHLMTNSLLQPCSERQFQMEGNASQTYLSWEVPHKQKPPGTHRPPPPAAATDETPHAASAGSAANSSGSTPGTLSRHRRAQPPQPQGQGKVPSKPQRKAGQPQTVSTTVGSVEHSPALDVHTGQVRHQPLVTTWTDGNYLLILHFKPANPQAKFEATVTIRTFYGDENYISALDYPLLIFYGVMGLIYIGFGVVWLLLLACNWRDLLRVQFWIGAVILLGMLEKAVFFAEYENINKTGESATGTILFAELVSCLKRTLARMLVIIVSLGFGIVKPRLGQAFNRVLLVGLLFLVFSAIEGYMRTTSSKVEQSNQFLLAAVPLAVLDAIICWWISFVIWHTRHAAEIPCLWQLESSI
ncbi:hypothetical protein ACOMHN_023149 [Nucella lapillus]